MTAYQTFMDAMKEVSRVGTLENLIGKGNADESEGAGRTLRQEAFDDIPEELRGNLSGPDGITTESRQAYVRRAQSLGIDKADTMLCKSTEELVGAIPVNSLEKLTANEEVVGGIPDGDKEILQAYQAYAQANTLPQRHKKGKLTEQEGKFLQGYIAKTAGDENAKRLKAENLGIDITQRTLDAARNIASLAIEQGYAEKRDLDKYVTPAIKMLIEKSKKNYDKISSESGRSFENVMRERVAKMTENVGEREVIRSALYSVGLAT